MMSESAQKKVIPILTVAGAIVGLALLFYFRYRQCASVLLSACDATFVIGLLYLCWASVRLLHVERARTVRLARRTRGIGSRLDVTEEDPDETVREQKKKEEAERKKNNILMLIIGGVLFIISFILLALYK